MKALINKEMFYGCSVQTKQTNNESIYNSENDVALLKFDNGNLKLKKSVNTEQASFIDFFVGKAKKFDEIIVSFDVRNISGESVVSLRTSFNEEKVAVNKIASKEWRNRQIKLVLSQDSDFTFFTIKVLGYKVGECEIRNVILTHKSNVLPNVESQNKKYLTQAISNLNATSNEFIYLGYFKKKQYGMNSINAMSFNESRTELYIISYWNNAEFMQDARLKAHRTALTVPKIKGFHYEFYFYEEDDKFHIAAKKIAFSQGIFILSSSGEYANGITPVDFSQYIKIKNYDAGVVELASVAQLNTYHVEKMKQENVYDDYISYMDEKTLYDKQQRKLEQDRQLAYEEALKENPELTFEEFMSVQPMTLNLVEEPQPSQALKDFMDKYL